MLKVSCSFFLWADNTVGALVILTLTSDRYKYARSNWTQMTQTRVVLHPHNLKWLRSPDTFFISDSTTLTSKALVIDGVLLHKRHNHLNSKRFRPSPINSATFVNIFRELSTVLLVRPYEIWCMFFKSTGSYLMSRVQFVNLAIDVGLKLDFANFFTFNLVSSVV